MSDLYYHAVRNCLEGARNGRFCAGAEEAATTIKELQSRLQAIEKQAGDATEYVLAQINAELRGRLQAVLEGQDALKEQTVRIRRALTDDRSDERDTEEIARTLAYRLSSCEKALVAVIRQIREESQPMVVAAVITEHPDLRNVIEACWPGVVERQEILK